MIFDIEKILSEWEKDSAIGQDLSEASIGTPLLHAKYLKLYSQAKMKLRLEETTQKILLKQKWLYYAGKMSREEVEATGWELDPFGGNIKPLKGEMDHYYNSDADIITSEDKVVYYKNLVDTIKEILDTIKWRHQGIRNAIDFKRFEAGN